MRRYVSGSSTANPEPRMPASPSYSRARELERGRGGVESDRRPYSFSNATSRISTKSEVPLFSSLEITHGHSPDPMFPRGYDWTLTVRHGETTLIRTGW